MKTINKTTAKELIKESKGKIFSTTFVKKDNTIRTLTSRTGKQYKSKTGRKAPYNKKKAILVLMLKEIIQ